MAFLDLSALGLSTTTTELLDDWLAQMQAAYPGYQPDTQNSNGSFPLEYIQAQAIAALLSDVSQAGVVVPDAIVRAFGTKLFNVLYLTGTVAQTVLNVTAVDASGYTLPAGTDVYLSNTTGFTTLQDLVIPVGQTSGSILIFAVIPGTAANGVGNPASLVSTVDWVASVSVVSAASGGVDPESDDDYQARLAAQLQLLTPRPITAQDYATMSLSFQPASDTDQQEIGRATALDGYLQGNASFTVSENSSATLTVTAPPATGITAAQGATITGTNIPSGTIVQSSTSSTITMSKSATGTASGITATVGGTLGNARTVTVAPTLSDGTATNSDTKTALAAWLASMREINFVVGVIDPTYTPVYVSGIELVLYPGFDPATAASAVQQALILFLSPTTFGLPPFGDQQQWLSGTTIYYNQLIGVIQGASQGAVRAVVDGSMTVGLTSSPTGTVDVVLPGPLGLPTSTTSTVALPTVVS